MGSAILKVDRLKRVPLFVVLTAIGLVVASATAASAGSVLGSGGGHTCWEKSGAVKCLGANGGGQLGDGSRRGSNALVEASGLESGATFVDGGPAENCAVVSGALRCWGWSQWNFVSPDYQPVRSATPVVVQGLTSGVSAVSIGNGETCALVNGAVRCWGFGDFFPEYPSLANWTSITSTPIGVPGLDSGVTELEGSGALTCAIQRGAAICWGAIAGQRGNPQQEGSLGPAPVLGLESGTEKLAVGGKHACAIVAGAAKCWGESMTADSGMQETYCTVQILRNDVSTDPDGHINNRRRHVSTNQIRSPPRAADRVNA